MLRVLPVLFGLMGSQLHATEPQPSSTTDPLLSLDFGAGVESIVTAGRTLDRVLAELSQFGPNFAAFLVEMAQYGFRPGTAVLAVLLALAVACVAEFALRGVFARMAPGPSADPALRSRGWLFWRVVAEVSALATFGMLVFLPAMVWLRDDPVSTAILAAVVQALLMIRAAEAILRYLLMPRTMAPGTSNLGSRAVRRLYISFLAVATLAALAYVSSGLFQQGGLAPITLLAFTFSARGLVSLALLLALFANRRTLTNVLVYRSDGSERSGAWQRFGANWHLFAGTYIALSFLGTSFLLLTEVPEANRAALWSFLVLILALILALGLDGAMAPRPAQDSSAPSRSLWQDMAARTGGPSILGATFIALVSIWSPLWSDLPLLNISPDVRSALLQVAVIVYLTFLLWQIVNAVSAHYGMTTAASTSEAVTQLETRSRFGTLVPLVKITLLIGLVLVSTISTLSAIGVDVLPLFAGAGIIGLAIGLGSQTLVKDAVSGIFFLIDDAFRIGEYVDLGFAKGTVESISIRSMRLRHQLGTVHTVPYGNITTIANMSRDWVIMRVEFRVPFDVDTEDLRKKIKALGKDLMKDEQIGSKFLEPLKSTGVVGIEEAAMIIRCKYTARPGDQWELRRRVYEELRRLLAREGISVAVRQVQMRAPEDGAAQPMRSGAGAEAALDLPPGAGLSPE